MNRLYLRGVRVIGCTMAILVLGCCCVMAEEAPNTLTDQEKEAGWRLLWDGKTGEGWRSPGSESFPTRGWTIKDGELTIGAAGSGGDIITQERFSNFEFKADFKTSPGCNSGVKYLVQIDIKSDTRAGRSLGSVLGPEFQILDDEKHPDAKAGRDGNRTLGSLYDLIPAIKTKSPNPIGEWNTARIVVKGNHVEHWLNDTKMLEYERDSDAFKEAVSLSKYKPITDFAQWPDGHILLQDHGNLVSFRNIKIRALTDEQ